jgi:RNA methyltransferase, TrmH family
VAAAAAHGLVEEVFATDPAARRHRALLDAVRGVTVHPVTEAGARALSETVTPSGLIAVCRTPEHDPAALLAGPPGLVAVAVDLGEPGNAGTLIRTAHAMGAAAVVLSGASVDPYNGKCLRSSAGSIFAVPVLVEPDPGGLLDRLRAAGMQILATTVDGESTLPDCEPLLGAPTAWVFGSESAGLEPALAAAADRRVRIPMAESAESLNVAAAAAICLHQSARARTQRLG